MSTKNNPGKYDCYNAAEPDEPTFTLRAKDPSAATLVRQWAGVRLNQIMCGQKPNTPEQMAKIGEALKCADDMQAWHHARFLAPALEQAQQKLHDAMESAGYESAAPEKPKPN